MSKKTSLFLIIVLCFACFIFQSKAVAISTSTEESIDDLKDALQEEAKDFAKDKVDDATQVIGNEVSGATQSIIRRVPNKALEIIKNVSKKVLDFTRGSIDYDVKQWFNRRKDAIMHGLEEEKQEFGGNIKEVLSEIWENIKDIFRRGEKSEE